MLRTMLRTLDIRDLLIIDRLNLVFQPGLNVLTGETGAGKSILLDALGFVLGWRGRAELVRSGAEKGEVTATFELHGGHPAFAVLAEAGIDAGADDASELILRRVNFADGRKSAWVNDRRVSGDVLRLLSDTLVELHGQQDDRGLLNPRGHRALLDDFAGNSTSLDAVRTAWAAQRILLKESEEAAGRIAALRAEEDYLRHAVAELDKLDPLPGEEAELDGLRRLMQGAERIRSDITRAATAISSDGAERLVTDAIRWLDGASGAAEGRLDAPLEALARASDALAEAERGIADCLDALQFNPSALEETEERLFAIRALARKHGVLPDDLGSHAQGLRHRLAALDASEADRAGLVSRLASAETAYRAAAATLSERRREAAQRLTTAMMAELAPLKMERAVFAVSVRTTVAGPDGNDDVTFEVATNPGAPAGPLNRIASGGELSRFLLALKVCLTRGNTGLTLIFDEIDRGVGGATADAVGRRLSGLARNGQVLVVTHSPQVAALGQHHWRVEKSVSDGMTTSRVVLLDEGGRVDEIARMLAGDTVTEAARGAARVLLNGVSAA
jgi:DNA repair protein RecN (Recombination protein N)